jgi:hypothetical protein
MNNENGFTIVHGLLIACVLSGIGFAGWNVMQKNGTATRDSQQSLKSDGASTSTQVSSLPNSDYLEDYVLEDEKYGTMTTVTISGTTRVITTNALPNHETGEFPNNGNPNSISAQNRTWSFPTNPTYTGNSVKAREPGVAINGVKFEPGTAERVTCSSGQTYNIEALQDIADLGLDVNNAHVQPTGEYHYHGISSLLVEIFSNDNDMVHIGFAADGHLMYYSKSGAYSSSYTLGTGDRKGTNCTYSIPRPSGGGTLAFDGKKDGSLTQDWEFNEANGNLDECNGTIVNGQYIYVITNEFPYIPRCLKGNFTESAPSGPPANRTQPSGPPARN